MKDDVRTGQTTLAAAVSLALATMWAPPVLAQDSGADEDQEARAMEEVIVSSFRRSLENSLELKRGSDLIVEAVSAEEIGKLPDVSIAESLARLPGLTAQRLNGRAQVISVRGLAPDFTTALLNGRPQVSTGDNRGVEFDQYPSELLSSAVVYKTPHAALIGQGLAGTVDLRTIRPLAYGKQAFAGNIRYERNELDALNAGSENDGVRYSASYFDQFMDDKIGLALGYAHVTNPSQEERFNAWGYTDSTDLEALVVNGTKPYVRSSDLERDGFIAVLEANVNERLSTSLDIYASNFSETQWLRGIEWPLGTALVVPGTIENGVVISGSFEETKGVVRNDVNERDSQLRAIGWNVDYQLDDSWSLNLDLSYSGVKRNDVLLETYSGTGQQGEGATDDLSFSIAGAEGLRLTSTLDYTDPDLIMLASPQGWGSNVVPGGQLGYSNQPRTEDELGNTIVAVKRHLGGNTFNSMEFGLNFSRRAKALLANEFFLGLSTGLPTGPLPASNGITDLSFLGIPGIISYDPLDALSSGIYRLTRNEGQDVVVKSWDVEEDITLGFAKFNLETSLFNMPVTGNMGLQIVHTDQSSNAFGARPASVDLDGTNEGTVTIPLQGGRTYTDVLPSINLNFEVADSKFVRIGLARTLARARMDEMRASETFSFDTSKGCADAELVAIGLRTCDPTNLEDDSPWSRDGGNTQLDPWMANALDVTFEMYFAEKAGYFAVQAFYKDLESYIFNEQSVEDFSGLPTGGFTPLTNLGLVTRPVNGTGGEIRGAEFAFSMSFDAFWRALTGFGFTGSASYTDSKIVPFPESPSTPLPGLSKNVSNVTLYYERGGFSARVSRRARSDFLGEVQGFGGSRDRTSIVEGETIIDAQVGYNFTQGPLTGMSVLLQGNNLTDEPFRTFYNDDPRQVRDYQRYGATYLLGFSFKY